MANLFGVIICCFWKWILAIFFLCIFSDEICIMMKIVTGVTVSGLLFCILIGISATLLAVLKYYCDHKNISWSARTNSYCNNRRDDFSDLLKKLRMSKKDRLREKHKAIAESKLISGYSEDDVISYLNQYYHYSMDEAQLIITEIKQNPKKSRKI